MTVYLVISAIVALFVGILVKDDADSKTLKGVFHCCLTGLMWPIIAVMFVVSLFSGDDWLK